MPTLVANNAVEREGFGRPVQELPERPGRVPDFNRPRHNPMNWGFMDVALFLQNMHATTRDCVHVLIYGSFVFCHAAYRGVLSAVRDIRLL